MKNEVASLFVVIFADAKILENLISSITILLCAEETIRDSYIAFPLGGRWHAVTDEGGTELHWYDSVAVPMSGGFPSSN